MSYSSKLVEQKIENYVSEKGWQDLYNFSLVNNENLSADKHPYTEICASWIRQPIHLKTLLSKMHPLKRSNPYHKVNHEQLDSVSQSFDPRTKQEARKECHLAQALYLQSKKLKHVFRGLKHKGIEIIDYEVPTKNGRGAAIDLLGYEHSQDLLYFFELKYNDEKHETLLRCILESLTYLKSINREKFLYDFAQYDNRISQKTRICISPLFVKGSSQHNEFVSLKTKYTELTQLVHDMIGKDILIRFAMLSIGGNAINEPSRTIDVFDIHK